MGFKREKASMMVDPYEQGKMFSILGIGYSDHFNDDTINWIEREIKD